MAGTDDIALARAPVAQERETFLSQGGLRTVLWNVIGWLPFVILLIVWEVVGRSGLVTPFTLPTLSSVLERIWSDAVSGDLFIHVGVTIYRSLLSFIISGVLGILIGVLIARMRWARWLFDPIVSVGFPMPKIAFLPLFILWFGFYDASKVTMVVFNTIFPIITATMVGIAGVEREVIWSARNLGVSDRRLLWDILLPASLPAILTGLQVALPIALIVGILTEMAMGGYGIGAAMQTASRFADSRGVFAGILEIAVIGYFMVKGMTVLRRRLLLWHQEALEPTTV